MGSHMKSSIFKEQTARAIKRWQKAAKNRQKIIKKAAAAAGGGGDGSVSSSIMSGETTTSQGVSPLHLLRKYQMGNGDIESAMTSPSSYMSDTELSELGSSFHSNGRNQSHPLEHTTNLRGSGRYQMQESSSTSPSPAALEIK